MRGCRSGMRHIARQNVACRTLVPVPDGDGAADMIGMAVSENQVLR
jgi:hypothetical protein